MDLDESRRRGVPLDPHRPHPHAPPARSGHRSVSENNGLTNGNGWHPSAQHDQLQHDHEQSSGSEPTHHVPQHHNLQTPIHPIIYRHPRHMHHEKSSSATRDLDGEMSGLQAAAAKTALFIDGKAARSSLDGDVVTTEADDDDQSSHWIFRRHVGFSGVEERQTYPRSQTRGPYQNGHADNLRRTKSTPITSAKDPTDQSERNCLLEQLNALRTQRRHLQQTVSTSLSTHLNEWNLRLSSAQQSHQTALSKLEEVSAKRMWTEEEYQMACKWHVLGDVFCIWHRGPFGTINGFRLGKSATTMAGLVKKCAGSGGNGGSGAGQAGSGGRGGSSLFSWGASENATTSLQAATTSKPNRNVGNSTNPTGAAPEKIVVPWNEINSALGQIVFLLHTLQNAPHSGISFRRHAFQLAGSASKIGVLKKNASVDSSAQPPRTERRRITALAAYVNAGATDAAASTSTAQTPPSPSPPISQSAPLPGEVTWYNLHHYEENGSVLSMGYYARRNFNTALEGLLYCIAEACLVVEKRDMALAAPYVMRVDGLVVGKDVHGYEGTAAAKDGEATVGELPLAYDPAAGEQWTMVCKYLLTNLKWLIAYAAKHVDR